MNRIILIGNGFDLAHNLPTGFNDFLDDYWKNILENIMIKKPFDRYEDNDIIIDKIPRGFAQGNSYEAILNAVKIYKTKIRYKNILLQTISEKRTLNKWVDIENEYYQILKSLIKNPSSSYGINKMNTDFERLRLALEQYIKNIENNFTLKDNKIRSQIGNKIYSKISFKDLSEEAKNKKTQLETDRISDLIMYFRKQELNFDELTKSDQELVTILSRKEDRFSAVKKMLGDNMADFYFDLLPENILFLNFNYSKTHKYYEGSQDFYSQSDKETLVPDSINIHGSVYTHDKNPIIFGFGDEIDENYKILENLNDNRYLEHIKSIKYLETDNYKNLLEFINSDDFQVFIFGHSCGISDRTLLNTIFEHKNCASIKPFYFKSSEDKDNFADIVMNITRNFNDKTLLRDRVVNKSACEPLLI